MVQAMLTHLHSRHLDPSLYPGVVVDTDSVTFPLWNLSGQMVGYQVYRPDKPKCHKAEPREQRYYTYVSRYGGKEPANAVWGLETLRLRGPVFLCEGVFDACRLHSVGLSALALLGSDPVHLRSWLSTLPQLRIALVQGDAAGRKLAKYGHSAVYLPDGQDVGDLSNDLFNDLFRKYTK